MCSFPLKTRLYGPTGSGRQQGRKPGTTKQLVCVGVTGTRRMMMTPIIPQRHTCSHRVRDERKISSGEAELQEK